MTQLGLLVTDASPLITLAAADALDCLTMPSLPVIIPDMVYFEVTQDLARTGATSVVDFGRGGTPDKYRSRLQPFLQNFKRCAPSIRQRGRGDVANWQRSRC